MKVAITLENKFLLMELSKRLIDKQMNFAVDFNPPSNVALVVEVKSPEEAAKWGNFASDIGLAYADREVCWMAVP